MTSDEALMAAHQAGDARAFPELVRRYGPALTGLFLRNGLREDEAGDLVQQTFLHLHRARHDYDPARALRPWVLTIALNLLRQSFRRKGRAPVASLEVEPAADAPAAGEGLERRETQARVRAALAALPEAQREVIELHWFQGLPFAQVAPLVGASLSAVKVRAHRGYERLRALLGGPGAP